MIKGESLIVSYGSCIFINQVLCALSFERMYTCKIAVRIPSTAEHLKLGA